MNHDNPCTYPVVGLITFEDDEDRLAYLATIARVLIDEPTGRLVDELIDD